MVERAAGSALDALKPRMESSSWSGARLSAGEPRAQIDVRARGNAAYRAAAILGVASLPVPNRVIATRNGECYWLGPTEWLWVGPPGERRFTLRALEKAIVDDDGAVVDVSSSRVILDLVGPSAREVLASCCALDLHPRVFGPGQCAQTLVGKAPVLLTQVDVASAYRLFLRPSFAAYVVSWLTDGMDGARAERPELKT
jgi:sarcosine oxidase subunit gamma